MRFTRLHTLFAVMCVLWGLTWIAIKIGVPAVPPMMFAGTRFFIAGAVLLLWLAARGGPILPVAADLPRLAVVTLLMISVAHAVLFWGVQFVTAGLASVVNLSLMPLAMYLLGILHREDRFSVRQSVAVALGIAGLALLLGPRGSVRAHAELAGLAAVVVATVSYAWGSVLSRPLLRRETPVQLAGLTMFLGGIALIVLSPLMENIDAGTVAAFLRPDVFLSWLYLVLFGSLVGFTIFMLLVRDWGAGRAGMFAFVSPIVGVAGSVLAFGDRFGYVELAGMAIMLGATWLSMTGRPSVAAMPAPAGTRASTPRSDPP